ncbi:MAG: type I DNA topoisomerase [Acidobacteria bacterium]|nr:type I DNA topoisomerase [Acidobacteriota bacterium]
MSALLILNSGERVKTSQKAVGPEIAVIALPGLAADFLPPPTESGLDYLEPRRRSGGVTGPQAQLQSLTREASSIYLAFPAGGAGEALAAVVQKVIRGGRPPASRPPQILRLSLEPGGVVTGPLLATAALVDLGLARAYQTQLVLENLLQQRAGGLEPPTLSHYHHLVAEARTQVAEGRGDARSLIRDFADQLGAIAVAPPAPAAAPSAPACPRCGQALVVRQGTQGPFTGCAGYPRCNFVLEASTGVRCPQCLRGYLVERRGEQDRVFYGCTRFPDCRFTSTRKPAPGVCPDCGNSYLVERPLKSGVRIECPRKDCGFRQARAR